MKKIMENTKRSDFLTQIFCFLDFFVLDRSRISNWTDLAQKNQKSVRFVHDENPTLSIFLIQKGRIF